MKKSITERLLNCSSEELARTAETCRKINNVTAEEYIKERAISVYREICPYHYRDGRCSFNNYKKCIHTKCKNIELFVELLNKEE